MSHKYLGQPRKIIDGLEKVTGHARYAADLSLQGMLHAKPVLSPYVHARIVQIDARAALALPGVIAVLTGDDLEFAPASSRPGAILAQTEVMFAGQPVAVVVARSEQLASDAAALLEVEYEALPVIAQPDQALEANADLVWPDGLGQALDVASAHGGSAGPSEKKIPSNLHSNRTYKRGDVAHAFAQASVIVEHTYTNAWVHQGYLEPHAVVAEPDGRGGLTVHTSTQGQYVVRDEVSNALGLPTRKVRVVPMVVGGAFGAKYGILDPLVAAIALKLQQPVRMVLSRSDDFLMTTPGPGTRFALKTACSSDGKLLAIQAEVLVELGIYPFGFTWAICAPMGGLYHCENVQLTVTEVFTHKPAAGAYRAPAVPQALFALEGNIDQMARTLNMDPLEFRILNAARTGDPMGINAPWSGNVTLQACLERLREHPSWVAHKHNPKPNEGIGIALGAWPGAFGPAGATCRVEADGTVRLQVGSVDISGVHSSLVLIAAETLGVNPESVELVQGTTDSGPVAPPSGGSQITVSLTGAVLEASNGAKTQLLRLAGNHFEAHPDDLELANGTVRVKGVPEKTITLGALAAQAESKAGGPGPVLAEGRSAIKAGSPGFTAHMVRVHVDPNTGQVTPLEYVNVQDVGFALNPMLVEGQMHGGSVQGLGIGLFEAVRFDAEGNPLSSNFLEYAMPRANDVPGVQAIILETPSSSVAFGARVVGEPPITAGAAAVANAICDAVGVRVTELPIKPETVWQLMGNK